MSEVEIVGRLRANLPVCPFDPKAPKSDLQPEDACPVCGGLGTDDAENVCKGADTRIMDEAATLIESLSARLREAESERDRARLALKAFVDFSDKRDAQYAKRGGNMADFPDTHPAYDISAYDLPLWVWRKARNVLAQRNGE